MTDAITPPRGLVSQEWLTAIGQQIGTLRGVGAAYLGEAWRVFCSAKRLAACQAAERALVAAVATADGVLLTFDRHRAFEGELRQPVENYWEHRTAAERGIMRRLCVGHPLIGGDDKLWAIGRPQHVAADFMWVLPKVCLNLETDNDHVLRRGKDIVFADVIVIDPTHPFARAMMTPAVTPSKLPKEPRNPVMRLILGEARRRGERPTPQQMIDWLQRNHSGKSIPSAAAIGRMLSRYY